MPYFETADATRLFYKDFGTGPPVVLVHAWSLSSAMWEYQLPVLLDARHRCVAMDRRGHGRSDVPGTGYDLDTLADDLAAVDVPTLVVHGDADASAPIDVTGRPTAALLPDARLEVYPGAPHGLYVTERERLAKDLLGFVHGTT